METYRKFLTTFKDFKDDYLKELQKSNDLLKDAFVKALDAAGLRSAKEGFNEIEDILQKLNSLSGLGNKIRVIQQLKYKFEREIINLSHRITKDVNKEKAVNDVIILLDEIVYFLKNTNKKIIDKTKLSMRSIADCPFGQAENRTNNALEFQRNIIELFSWLFIDEIKLLTKDEITQEQLIRDGVYEVLDDFDFYKRGVDRIRFSHIVIECKNYRKPSYDDLMQVYAYTLLNKIYPLVNKPLCLIISRENPSEDSIAQTMRDKLFEKEGDNFLLVLFLSCEDLNKMVEIKENSGDPFIVLNENIKKIFRANITKEV